MVTKPEVKTVLTEANEVTGIDEAIERLQKSNETLQKFLERPIFIIPDKVYNAIADHLLTDELGATVKREDVSEGDIIDYALQAIKNEILADYGRDHTPDQVELFKSKYHL